MTAYTGSTYSGPADSQDSSPFAEIFADSSDFDNTALLRSFDMIFRLHQRSEEIRVKLEKLDRVLLSSRNVASLVERAVKTMEQDMDLVATRMLFRDDHPIATAFGVAMPDGAGFLPASLLQNETLFQDEPFVLDYPSGELAHDLFGESAGMVASAVVATLCCEGGDFGLLCLGSDDADRYCGGMNTELIAGLSDKISLAILNAWQHESQARRSLVSDDREIYTELFFREYVRKEFHRSWRTHRPFSVLAVSWGRTSSDNSDRSVTADQLKGLIRSNLRSADVVAEGETCKLWVMLADTDIDGGRAAAQRILELAAQGAGGRRRISVGLTAFSRHATAASMVMNHAMSALEEAMQEQTHTVIAKDIEL